MFLFYVKFLITYKRLSITFVIAVLFILKLSTKQGTVMKYLDRYIKSYKIVKFGTRVEVLTCICKYVMLLSRDKIYLNMSNTTFLGQLLTLYKLAILVFQKSVRQVR